MIVRSRQVFHNELVLAQAEFFDSDNYTPLSGLTPSDLTCQVFFDNILQPWSLLLGAGVSDSLVTSGQVFWSEIPAAAGTYSVRFRPSGIGFWRVRLAYPTGEQLLSYEFDVLAKPHVTTGLQTSFIK